MPRKKTKANKMPTLADIAAIANVSVPTVAKVLSGRCGTTRVSEGTKKRVHEIARHIGYQKHIGASQLVTGRTNAIGVVLSRFGSPFYGKLLDEILPLLVKEGLVLVPLVAGHSEDSAADLAERALRQRLVDGVIHLEHDREEVRAAQLAEEFPLAERVWSCTRGSAPNVVVNYESSMKQLLDLFQRTGRSTVGLVIEQYEGGTLNKRNAKVRLCIESMVEQGMVLRDNQWVVVSGETRGGVLQDAYVRTLQLLKDNPGIDALIVDSGELAIPVYKAVKEAGRVIGKDIAVAGWTDTDELPLLDPPMAVMNEPIGEVAEALVNTLLSQLRDQGDLEKSTATEISSFLVVRESLGVNAG